MNNYPQIPGGGGAFPYPVSGHPVGAPAVNFERFAPAAASELNFQEMARIIFAWRWLVLGCVAIGIVGATLVTLFTTPIYRATTRLEVSPPQTELIRGAEVGAPAQDDAFLGTQYGLLQSRALAERVVQELNLASNEDFVSTSGSRSANVRAAVSKLVSGIEVEPVKGSRLIDVSFSSESPVLTARVANSLATNFINSNLERRYEASSYARDFLQRRIASLKAELEGSERKLIAYAQQEGIVSTGAGEDGGSQSLDSSSLTLINNALAQAQTERIAAEQRYRQGAGSTNTVEVNASSTVQSLRTQRAQLLAQYQEKLGVFKPDFPDMVRLQAQIAALGEQIAAEASVTAGGRANTLRQDYAAAVAKENTLRQRVNALKSQVLNMRGRSIQYNILQRELDTNRSLYDALLQRYKEIGVAGGVGTNPVAVVDPARTPTSPFKPNLILNLLVGLLIGIVSGIGAAFALEFINDTIKSPDDIRKKLHLASLGAIPLKTDAGSMSTQLEDTSSPVAEAYYSLRTAVQYSTPEGSPKLLLVTSTRAAEGKSSTTMALAQNFARLGNRVLLIDADMRKPAFVANAQAGGLSTLLTGRGSLLDAVFETKVEMLTLLACGPIPPNPAELLASPNLRRVLSEAKQNFDMVIVDGPPVLGLADAPLLGAACDQTLLVVESGKTRRAAILESIMRLRASGTQILGAVLTKYNARSSGYGYNYEPYKYGGVVNQERRIELIESPQGQVDA